jgi:hypothetical protein
MTHVVTVVAVVTFAIDPQTGLLSPTGHVLEIAAPNCICFLPPLALDAMAGGCAVDGVDGVVSPASSL